MGDICVFNTDCLSGMYCSSGHCGCLSTFVAVDGYCYESMLPFSFRMQGCFLEVNPGRMGCTYDAQCSAVWPDSTCASNMCNCPDGYKDRETRDGAVCVDLSQGTPFVCPLPDGVGPSTALSDVTPLFPGSAFPILCNTKSSNVPATKGTYTGDNVCVYTTTTADPTDVTQKVIDVSDIYDCIQGATDVQSVISAIPLVGYSTNADGVCCMSRGKCANLRFHILSRYFSVRLHPAEKG